MCNTIDFLLSQDYKNYEIIIADQSTEHKEETNEFLERIKNKIRYFKMDVASLTCARNLCIKEAKGEIIIFIDDDVIIDKDFITKHAQNYTDKDVYSVVGKVISSNGKSYPDKKANPVTLMGRTILNLTSDIKGEVNGGMGCNMSFRKRVFLMVGFFDEKWPKPFLREETDLFYRIKRKALKVVFEPEAKLIHLKNMNGGCEADRGNFLKVINKQNQVNPSLNEGVYNCDTIFHLKYFTRITIPLLILYHIFAFVFKFNFSNPCNLYKSFIAMLKGFNTGLKYYKLNY